MICANFFMGVKLCDVKSSVDFCDQRIRRATQPCQCGRCVADRNRAQNMDVELGVPPNVKSNVKVSNVTTSTSDTNDSEGSGAICIICHEKITNNDVPEK